MRLMAIVEAATVTGPAKNLIDFCLSARAMGIPLQPRIVTFQRGSQDRNEFVDYVRKTGIELRIVPEQRMFDPGVIRELSGMADEWKPDFLQTHAVKSHFLVALSRLWKRYPWVAFHHGYTQTDLKMGLYNQLDRWSLRKPSRLVTVSEAFKRQLLRQGVGEGRISILQNAVNPDWVERVRNADPAAVRRELGLEGRQIILAVGRMSKEKAHNDLIEAFHAVKANQPRAALVLVGDGPERPGLERLAGEGVLFTGQQRDVTRFFAIADVMALPSLTEGSPNVLLEAMACGVPSVATSVGGVPEIVSHEKEALLVPARAPAQLAAAIGRVLAEPELRAALVANSLDTIRRRHSLEARAEALMRIYTPRPGD
ncbi:MAG TPA: glycosyltransferase family 4 protein [Bryobacteraceae bacterium]|jgi:glycosyltransferase involved in cell wall biosynthesis|nr:glycosyltransferase family 4 protein [Bryobacteraceae bacterium]